MAKKPTLSVAMTSYNLGRYIGEALQTILDQSFRPLEIIVVDDGSTDDSVEIVRRFAQREPIVRLVINERNMGAVLSTDKSISLASGDYVYALAADDKALPGLFEKSMRLLAQYPQAGLCCADVHTLDERGADAQPSPHPRDSAPARYIPPREAPAFFCGSGLSFGSQATIVRRDAFWEMGGFIPELRNYADPFLWMVIALKYGACYIPEKLGVWRVRATGYAVSRHADLDAQRDIARHAARLLQSPKYSSVVPIACARIWTRERIYDVLARGMNLRREQTEEMLDLFIAPRWPERLLAAGLRFLMELEYWWRRLYSFLVLRRESAVLALAREAERQWSRRRAQSARDPGGRD